MNAISFIVPYGFGIAFWILLYKTGYSVRFFSTYVEGLEYTGDDAQISKWLMILLTSCGIAGISWAFGALLSFIAEKIKSRKK